MADAASPPNSSRAWWINARDYAVYVIVRCVVCVLQMQSLSACATMARNLAWVFTAVVPVRRRVLRENLRNAFPAWTDAQQDVCIRAMWEHLFLMLGEMALSRRKLHRTNWRDHIQQVNIGQMMALMWQPRPKVIVSAHYGNFELAAYVFGLFGFETYAVARTLDNPYLDKFLNDFRAVHGQHLIEKDGSAVEIALLLERHSTLILLGDQHAGQKGCWVEFFGKPASTHKSIGLFVLGNEAPLGVSYSRRIGGPLQYEIVFHNQLDPQQQAERMDVTDVTRWFTQQFEEFIVRDPTQYWWLHRRWKGEPPVRKKKQAPQSIAS